MVVPFHLVVVLQLILANNEEGILWVEEQQGGVDVEFKVDLSGCGNNEWAYDWRFYYGLNLSQNVADPSNDPVVTFK